MKMTIACKTVEEIVNNKEFTEKLGLSVSHNREWKEFNFLIGENGAGKSRFLKVIKDNVQKKCNVIHMDFATLNVSGSFQKKYFEKERNELANAIIFRQSLDENILRDFTENVSNQVLRLFDELSQMMGAQSLMKDRAEQIIDKLNPDIKRMLNRKLIIHNDKICLQKENYIVELNSEWELLSPGEKSILVIIVAVLTIATMNNPCILLIDEIETHLHPLVQIEAYELLKRGLEGHDHCTCIASHSIFLLPAFPIKDVVYIKNGETQKINGMLYQDIYDKLVGQDGKESMSEFLRSVASWQYAEYLAECFLLPNTVDTARKNDEQACQLKQVLAEIYHKRQSVQVLDFGAGSARIGKCIELMLRDKEDEQMAEICQKLKYHIYDKYGVTDEFVPNSAWRGEAYASRDKLELNVGKFDIVLLFNVLHEVSVDEWANELNFIFRLLKDDGIVLFGERRILSVGEKPYGKSGYLVLEENELEKLFPDLEKKSVPLPKDTKGVTICYAIKKKSGRNVLITENNVMAAIDALEKKSRSKIKEMQNSVSSEGETIKPRNYAFYCQQYVNAQEALEILKENNSSKISNINSCGIDSKLTLKDILQIQNISKNERLKMLEALAEEETEEGHRCRDYMKRLEEEDK